MINQVKIEIWIGLRGANFAMRAEQVEQRPDDSVTFIRIVDHKGDKRKEWVNT